jgi:hypothetical protein
MTRLEIVFDETPHSAFSVDDIRIATPCHASWDEMHGDERVRFCGSCRKNVYTLDGMSKREIRTLFEETEGRACVRLYRREDGTVLTADCPIGLAAKAKAAARRAYAMSMLLVVSLVTGVLALFFSRAIQKPACDITTDVARDDDGRGRVMGAPPPLPVEHTMGAMVAPERALGEPLPLPPPKTPVIEEGPRTMGKMAIDPRVQGRMVVEKR